MRKQEGEYVSGVLKGDEGLFYAESFISELAKRCTVDAKCGMHIHIGSVNFNVKFLVNMYYLCLLVEKDMQKLLPQSRRKNEYCKNLKSLTAINNYFKDKNEISLKEAYAELISYMSVNEKYTSNSLEKFNKGQNHPMGNKCAYNKDTPRYCWMNFIPAIFNTRGNSVYTIEIRNHSATLSFKKVKYWLLIFMGLVDFAENYMDFVKNYNDVNLFNIIKTVYPKTYSKILEYMDERIIKFSSEDSKKEELDEYKSEVTKKPKPRKKIDIVNI